MYLPRYVKKECLADEMTQFQRVQSTYLPLPTPRVNKNVVNDTVCCYFSMLLVYLYTQACPADNYLSICEALVDILTCAGEAIIFWNTNDHSKLFLKGSLQKKLMSVKTKWPLPSNHKRWHFCVFEKKISLSITK